MRKKGEREERMDESRAGARKCNIYLPGILFCFISNPEIHLDSNSREVSARETTFKREKKGRGEKMRRREEGTRKQQARRENNEKSESVSVFWFHSLLFPFISLPFSSYSLSIPFSLILSLSLSPSLSIDRNSLTQYQSSFQDSPFFLLFFT